MIEYNTITYVYAMLQNNFWTTSAVTRLDNISVCERLQVDRYLRLD